MPTATTPVSSTTAAHAWMPILMNASRSTAMSKKTTEATKVRCDSERYLRRTAIARPTKEPSVPRSA
eukprot:6873085-Prymnesium_polylepis.1